MKPSAVLQLALKQFVDCIAPYTCLLCERQLSERTSTQTLCENCLSRLFGSRRNLAIYLDSKSEVTAIWSYQGRVKSLIQLYKYQGKELLKHLFAEALCSAIRGPYDMLIPIPSTRKSERKRGFSHMYHLAKQVSLKSNIPLCPQGLVLRDQSISQMGLALFERKKNRTNAFIAPKVDLVDKRVLVIDDVMTSGQTLRSAIKAIRSAKPTCVDAVLLARTPR